MKIDWQGLICRSGLNSFCGIYQSPFSLAGSAVVGYNLFDLLEINIACPDAM